MRAGTPVLAEVPSSPPGPVFSFRPHHDGERGRFRGRNYTVTNCYRSLEVKREDSQALFAGADAAGMSFRGRLSRPLPASEWHSRKVDPELYVGAGGPALRVTDQFER